MIAIWFRSNCERVESTILWQSWNKMLLWEVCDLYILFRVSRYNSKNIEPRMWLAYWVNWDAKVLEKLCNGNSQNVPLRQHCRNSHWQRWHNIKIVPGLWQYQKKIQWHILVGSFESSSALKNQTSDFCRGYRSQGWVSTDVVWLKSCAYNWRSTHSLFTRSVTD